MGATAAIGFMAVGSGMQYGANKQAGKSQQALHNFNAQIGRAKSEDALARGIEAEGIHRANTRRLIGDQRAAFAASGVDISDPDSTAVNVFADTAALSELDAITIRTNAAREAWGYRMQAQNDTALGVIAKQEADSKAIGAITSMAGNVLYGKYGFGSTTRGRTVTR
jgi:hypothetical protein